VHPAQHVEIYHSGEKVQDYSNGKQFGEQRVVQECILEEELTSCTEKRGEQEQRYVG
jgi:hypothetical protein